LELFSITAVGTTAYKMVKNYHRIKSISLSNITLFTLLTDRRIILLFQLLRVLLLAFDAA